MPRATALPLSNPHAEMGSKLASELRPRTCCGFEGPCGTIFVSLTSSSSKLSGTSSTTSRRRNAQFRSSGFAEIPLVCMPSFPIIVWCVLVMYVLICPKKRATRAPVMLLPASGGLPPSGAAGPTSCRISVRKGSPDMDFARKSTRSQTDPRSGIPLERPRSILTVAWRSCGGKDEGFALVLSLSSTGRPTHSRIFLIAQSGGSQRRLSTRHCNASRARMGKESASACIPRTSGIEILRLPVCMSVHSSGWMLKPRRRSMSWGFWTPSSTAMV
eukprot:5485018-Prymnesium_polylepis.3